MSFYLLHEIFIRRVTAHVLTTDEMPSHSHQYKRHAFDRTDTDPETSEDVYGANNKTLAAYIWTN